MSDGGDFNFLKQCLQAAAHLLSIPASAGRPAIYIIPRIGENGVTSKQKKHPQAGKHPPIVSQRNTHLPRKRITLQQRYVKIDMLFCYYVFKRYYVFDRYYVSCTSVLLSKKSSSVCTQ